MSENLQLIKNFISDAEILYVSTIGERGEPQCRPFGATVLVDDRLWFITKKTKKVWREITNNPKVCVVCCDKNKDYEWLRLDCEFVR